MKKIMKKCLSMLCIAALAVTSLCACSDGSSGTGDTAAKSSDTLNVQICAEPSSLDPAMNYEPGTFYVTPQVCDTLLNLSSDLKLEPNIASSWEKKDNTTYVYQLRDDVTFSDGSQMTADDVVYCLQRIIDPDVGSMVSWMFNSVESIEKTGDWEVTVKLSQPDSLFQYTMALSPGMIYSKEACEKADGKFGTMEGGFVGSGPYVLDSWTSGTEIKMTSNDNYWNQKDDIQIKNINFKIISDDTAVVTATNAGEIDLVTLLAGDYLDQIDSSKFNTKVVHSAEARSLFFNCEQTYTNDVNVRKALASCYDRDAFMNSAYKGMYDPSTGLLFGEKLYPDDSWEEFAKQFQYNYQYNVEQAKEYLSASKYPDGGFEITALVAANNGTEMKEAQLFQAAAKEINVDVKLKTVSDAELQTVAFSEKENGLRDYNVYVSGWISDYPDSMGYFETLLASWNNVSGAINFSQYENEEYDALLKKAHETDGEQRSEVLKEAANIVGRDCPIQTLGYNSSYFVLRSDLDYTFNGMDVWGLYLKNIKRNK
ncbi:MAG: ABC transporter substrate-binding protein [Eubacteriales bacterium]|nr:ABC transporter substrate-binding protein [Eubacteriales bacterium]